MHSAVYTRQARTRPAAARLPDVDDVPDTRQVVATQRRFAPRAARRRGVRRRHGPAARRHVLGLVSAGAHGRGIVAPAACAPALGLPACRLAALPACRLASRLAVETELLGRHARPRRGRVALVPSWAPCSSPGRSTLPSTENAPAGGWTPGGSVRGAGRGRLGWGRREPWRRAAGLTAARPVQRAIAYPRSRFATRCAVGRSSRTRSPR